MAIFVTFEVMLFLCEYNCFKENDYRKNLDDENYQFPISMLKYMTYDWEEKDEISLKNMLACSLLYIKFFACILFVRYYIGPENFNRSKNTGLLFSFRLVLDFILYGINVAVYLRYFFYFKKCCYTSIITEGETLKIFAE